MAVNTTWPEVTSFTDGQHVDAATLNVPIQELAARTEHLLRLLGQNDRTKVAIAAAEVSNPDGNGLPAAGQPVYRVGDGTYAKAIGSVGENEWFYADNRAMAVGVVGDISGTTATIVLCGYLSLGAGIDAGELISDASPASGRYYLSNIEAGKLTACPTGPVIYVCDCHIEGGKVKSMLVNPQYRDTGESHIHRSFVLSGIPSGGYAIQVSGASRYSVGNIFPDGMHPGSDGSLPAALTIVPYGAWDGDANLTSTYRFVVEKVDGSGDAAAWSNYIVRWSSTGEGSGTISLADLTADGKYTGFADIGTHHFKVRLSRRAGTNITSPATLVGHEWTVTMPDAGRVWLNTDTGFRLNLGMYPALARYVPPVPANGAALIVNGVEMRGPVFGSDKEWEIDPADSAGGPWLVWYGNRVVANSVTTPFEWTANNTLATARKIVLHANRMRVGPTGFVTSLQPAKGSPLRITSAQTDSDAVQGALQIGLDMDFKSSGGDVPGFQVVKRISGATFETGPVVERIIAGPGLTINQEQGSVRVSVSGAVYAGDFETIALKNAKQDLAGGVFPYTKLLGWALSGTNIDSGFTAKFRVPDHIPYNAGRGYNVIVSASVFGEEATTGSTARTASFKLRNCMLGDQACSVDAGISGFDGSISNPTAGYEATIGVPFSGPYSAYDPVLVHGFRSSASVTGPGALILPDAAQRHSDAALCLKAADGTTPIVVYPGYFVGIEIKRCATSGSAYTGPIGFLSLRWNLVEVPQA